MGLGVGRVDKRQRERVLERVDRAVAYEEPILGHRKASASTPAVPCLVTVFIVANREQNIVFFEHSIRLHEEIRYIK